MEPRNIVYTNKTVDFKARCKQAQERFRVLDMKPLDEQTLRAKHAYELGYTPDSWAREVDDGMKRTARRNSNLKARGSQP